MHILWIEDEVDTHYDELMWPIIEDGHTVDVANDATEAISKLEHFNYDFIIFDLIIGKGQRFHKILNNEFFDIPFIKKESYFSNKTIEGENVGLSLILYLIDRNLINDYITSTNYIILSVVSLQDNQELFSILGDVEIDLTKVFEKRNVSGNELLNILVSNFSHE